MVGVFYFAAVFLVAFGEEDEVNHHMSTQLLHVEEDSHARALTTCSDAWGEFDEKYPLTSSQMNHNPSVPADFSEYRDLPTRRVAYGSGLTVFPRNKFAICLIPKVGSSMWKNILLKMTLNDTSATNITQWELMASNFQGSAKDKTAVFSDPAATRAVFVREPVSRFTSAFLNKCVTAMKWCPILENVQDSDEPVTMRRAVDWMVSVDKRSVDAHWMPQSYFCELQRRVSEYTMVGAYSEENYGNDASCLMDMANLSYYNSKGPEYDNAPYWDDVAGDGASPPNDYHSSTDAEEHAVLQKLFTKDGAEKLIEALGDDYDTFHFPRQPEWLSGATGEWFDADFSGAQAPTSFPWSNKM